MFFVKNKIIERKRVHLHVHLNKIVEQTPKGRRNFMR